MEWTQTSSAELAKLISETDDPATSACAVIVAMAGVLMHFDCVELADDVLRDFAPDIEIRIRRPQSAKSPQRA